MGSIAIEVEERAAIGKNESRRLRRSGLIPAVLYGAKKDVFTVTVDPRAVEQILASQAGQNTLLQLKLKGKDATRHAMIKDFQVDPVTGNLTHADFVRIEMDATLTVAVRVRTVGQPPGVKDQGGVLEMVQRQLQVECLPSDIPGHIDIDVSTLTIGDNVRLSELTAAGSFRFLDDPETVLVTVLAPRAIEEEAPAEEVAEEGAEEPEVIAKGKKEDEGDDKPEEKGE